MQATNPACQISIRGSFGVLWSDYLGEMLLDVDVDSGKVRSTTLFGQLPDLSAFIGMLSLLHDLGYPVIACEYRCCDMEA